MMKNINSLIASVCFFLCIGINPMVSQVKIEGYAFETGNRGYLSEVLVEVFNPETNELISRTRSARDGKFELTAPAGKVLLLKGSRDLFHDKEMELSTIDKKAGEKAFVKLEMQRAPGYIFDITMAEKREDENQVVDAIRGALVEVYNNTIRKPVMVLEDHPHPDFKIDLEKGNHYTIMIRKEGYLAKRMEAFVDVKGCILCFEGIGEVQPGVSDNLTAGNSMGTLLANVELDKLYTGKKITLNNIYYDYGKATIRKDAVEELQNAATFLLDNPGITVELASHTDARGKAAKNQTLSLKRAKNTVDWLLENSQLPAHRIVARGYGESNPINKCKDGVDCTESEHAANRRTEFKVLTIAPQIGFKSLEKIKFEENMDEMIAELQNEGQVKVKEGEDVEKVAEKQKLIKENVKNSEPAERIEKEVEVTKEESTSELEIEEKVEKAEQVQEIVNVETKTEEVIEKAEEVIEVAKEEIMPTKEVVKAKAEIVEEVAEATASIDNSIEEATTAIATEVMPKKEAPVKAKIDASRLNTIGNFSGYKYVIHFSGMALADDHELFSKHDDLTVLQTSSNNFLYMIGDYASKVYANSGLSVIKKQYPEAYIIGFKDGERTE